MKTKLVIFDLDGTLADAYSAIISSFNFTMRSLGYSQQTTGVIRRAVGRGDERLLADFVRPKDLSKAVRLYRGHHKQALTKGAVLLPGARALLRRLARKNVIMAVATNRPTVFTRILIRVLGIEKYFAYVLCGDRLPNGKPHPEILQRIMRRLKMKPGQTIFVGDMTLDARTGRRAGVRTVIVTTGSSAAPEIRKEKPYKIISGIGRLERLL